MRRREEILVISGSEVDDLLDPASCIQAVEEGFRAQGDGGRSPTGVLGMHAGEGGFHIKAAASAQWKYFVAKVNGNFPANPERHALPTVQGVVLLFDGLTGSPLAIIDSVRITALRTAAASAVAARFLARKNARRLFVAGCGTQALAHVDAIRAVCPIEDVALYDLRRERVSALMTEVAARGLKAAGAELPRARDYDVIVTCTPSHHAFLKSEHVAEGAFVAAVGADNEHKQELDSQLMRRARVVVDSKEQCIAMGDTRSAISDGTMTATDIHADLAEIVSGHRPGRTADNEIFVFDSTGVALEDVAAAGAVYQRALAAGRGVTVTLNDGSS